ncbi:hypothetical protein Pedsa_1952 [Pseudopedobacter saltans DSM 12145]|uniref:Secretion system C-terminal sorting domain-containing protein n=1 Tax=Pseudopedobacter saltans (strain ATCC 51119 / DSM 12145 / JCM 21818 / CCUG 39354 / LMG 10337 / NBRC 100064 / NCIMB 13643) TaxID=762903 RepID=F0S9F5_PSESL|nr:T9SS type A sorting domain-containing protein [Pseudopedobacter saltans]ADY52505.1 hypothetical protein Pedsa_1952 [Pseudopedobacter saltans DSM 12145]
METSRPEKKLQLSRYFITILCALFMICNQATAQSINIATAADLAKIGNDANYPLNGDYVQTADINLSGYANWIPIGAFTGTYDGQYHYIDNLTIQGADKSSQGLFSEIGATGKVSSLHMRGVNINLAGWSSRIGAIAGYSYGKIMRVAVHNGTIRAYQQVGGIVGDLLSPGELSECYANVTVEDNGYVYSPPIPETPDNKGSYFGGLAGENRSIVTNCHAEGTVTGTSDVGGLIGYNTANSTISHNYSSGAVNGDEWLGGLIGFNGGSIEGSYWNITTSGQSTSHGTGAVGKTDAQMKQQATFAGWDFSNIWTINQGVSQPTLRWLDLAPLPVSLINFTAQAQGNRTKLIWQTAQETNNKEFIIYRSTDSKQFTEITRIAGAGNSSSIKNYYYDDENPLNGNNYYKLVQIDLDNKETELGIRIVSFELTDLSLQLYPNPTDDVVNISFRNSKYNLLTVTDLSGKVLQQVQIKPDESSMKVSLGNYPTGTYLLRFNGNDGTVTEKVMRK